MEKDTHAAEGKSVPQQDPNEKKDGIIVSFVKMLLQINFQKWGVKKDF